MIFLDMIELAPSHQERDTPLTTRTNDDRSGTPGFTKNRIKPFLTLQQPSHQRALTWVSRYLRSEPCTYPRATVTCYVANPVTPFARTRQYHSIRTPTARRIFTSRHCPQRLPRCPHPDHPALVFLLPREWGIPAKRRKGQRETKGCEETSTQGKAQGRR